jgi:hypothetical protein
MNEEFFTRIIMGDVATVRTVGIITAENPGIDNKLTKIGNERKNKELQEELEKAGFAPIQMKGKFWGKSENPFLVINISREKLISLGKKYKQNSVIFGEKKMKIGNKKAPLFEFSLLQNGRSVRKGVLGIEHPQNLIDRDCYFTLSGKKFNIHFNR